MFSLTVYRGDKLVQELDFDAAEVNIGRKPENAVVLPDDGKGVSRIHAILRVEDGEFVLYDGNSRNGTFVDGKPIKREVLYPGQDFVVGPYRLVLGAGEMAESAPTMVATRISAPPAGSPVPAEGTHSRSAESTQSRSSEGSTKSRLPAPSRTSGTTSTARGQSLPLPMPYLAAGGVVILLLGAVLIWQLMSGSDPAPEPVAEAPVATTSIPEPTTTIPEAPPPDPHADQIAEAMAAMDAAENAFAEKNYRVAARDFERVIRDRLAPILSVDATYAPALELEERAKTRAAEALKLAPPLPPKEEPIRPGPNDVAVRDGETRQDYDRRNKEAIQDYELGRRMFNEGDFLAAAKLFADLAAREPGWRDAGTYARNSQDSLEKERQRVLNEGLQFEGAGFKSANARNLAAAATELTAARKAFERAAALQAPQAQKFLAENLERRRFVAKSALDEARTHVNFRNRAEARKWFQLAIDLLPPGEPIRKEAESDLQKLAPGL